MDQENLENKTDAILSVQDEEANICCLCEHNEMLIAGLTHCVNKAQKNASLKASTKYNDGCNLFKEAKSREGIYDTNAPFKGVSPKYTCPNCSWRGDTPKKIKSPEKKHELTRGEYKGCPHCRSAKLTKNW